MSLVLDPCPFFPRTNTLIIRFDKSTGFPAGCRQVVGSSSDAEWEPREIRERTSSFAPAPTVLEGLMDAVTEEEVDTVKASGLVHAQSKKTSDVVKLPPLCSETTAK